MPYCSKCGKKKYYCTKCGELELCSCSSYSNLSIISIHRCRQEFNFYPIQNKKERSYCRYCGTMMPEEEYCSKCGDNITPKHKCPDSSIGNSLYNFETDPIHYCKTKPNFF